MAKILYISLNGMTEPLGESQVVQYLLELAKHNSIHLLSFEKPVNTQKYQQMAARLAQANIHWKYLEYSNRYGIFSSFFQIVTAIFTLAKWIQQEKIQIIHARSLIPAVIGGILKRIFNIKLLFDIRGFALDEKITDGRLKPHSILTWLLKKIEARTYKTASHVVTLTHASKPIIENKYRVPADKITVIPTCANLEIFKPLSIDEKLVIRKKLGFSENDFILLHHGSFNGWVDSDATFKLFEQLAKRSDAIKFLFLNKGQHEIIRRDLEKFKIDEDKLQIHAAEFSQVNPYLNIADLSVFFIKPSFAKQASAPTKFAEAVACNLYSVTNTNYGDMEYYLNHYRVGLLLDLTEVHNEPEKSALKLLEFIKERNQITDTREFERLFSQHFSKQLAVERYQQIYDHLTGNEHESIVADQV